MMVWQNGLHPIERIVVSKMCQRGPKGASNKAEGVSSKNGPSWHQNLAKSCYPNTCPLDFEISVGFVK